MLNKGKSQKTIFYSKDISSLPTQRLQQKLLPFAQIDEVHPRIFPNIKIPMKIAIMRKLKAYQQFDLNTGLANIDWKFQKGVLQLTNFNYSLDIIMHQCTKQRLQKKIIKGRAYDYISNTFKQFIVTSYQKIQMEYFVSGYFASEPTKNIQINKFYVCFNFQNPQLFSQTIFKAVANREVFLNSTRYGFYVDNLDFQQAPEIPKSLMKNISKFIGVELINRQQYLQLNKHYKRVMNQLLFNKILLQDDNLQIQKIQVPQKRKRRYYKPKSKVITLMKDNKLFKLTLKSLQTKIDQLQSKFLYAKEQIIILMRKIHSKLLQIYDYKIFDLKDQICVIDKFTADNALMSGYFMLFVQEKIINQIGQIVRKTLINHADGWFKIYQTDRKTYLMSKLRRLFINIQQNIKSILKQHVASQIQRYINALQKRIPKRIDLQSFSKYKLWYEDQNQIQYCPLININIVIGNNTFEMTIKKQKLADNLKKSIQNILKRISKINSPQSIALVQIFSKFKDEYGITIQIPLLEAQSLKQTVTVNNYQYQWIGKDLQKLHELIDKSIDTLIFIQKQFGIEAANFNLKTILNDNKLQPIIKIQEILFNIGYYRTMHTNVQSYLPGNGINYGLFYIDYTAAKNQFKQSIEKKINSYQLLLIKQYRQKSTNIQTLLTQLYHEMKYKPMDVYQLVNQRQKMLMLQRIIQQFRHDEEVNLYNLCQENLCFLNKQDSNRRWTNSIKIKQLFILKEKKFKQYQIMKQQFLQQTQRQQALLDQMLILFATTLNNIKSNHLRQNSQQNHNKLEYLNTQYLNAKNQIKSIRYKELHLHFQPKNFSIFDQLEESFLTLFTFWQTVNKWQIDREIWYNQPLKSFTIDKIEFTIFEMLSNIKKIQNNIKLHYSNELFTLITEVKKEIMSFQDAHLRLLKILKKDGFNSKHLMKVGIYIQEEMCQFTLQKAIDNDFLSKIEQLTAVANDAWNEYYLEQTLNRVLHNLVILKYDIIYYLDKKNNEIPLINNYSILNTALQEIILQLESIQFNPMKSLYQKRINDLFEKSIYISKTLEACQIFQTKFIELHPIFDSTDVVKQLPVQNKLFVKILKRWIQLLEYMKKIISLYDSCNGQNIYEKMISMIQKLETVKVGLSNYLNKKRQGFNRFYLLTDQQLYEIFASTNDMNILSKHISKLFHSVNKLIFDHEKITAVEGKDNILQLKRVIFYKNTNLQDWLNNFQQSMRETIKFYIQKIIKTNNKWTNMLNFDCSQVLLLCYQIFKTQQIERLKDFKKLQEQQKKLIHKLIQIKKTRQLSAMESVNFSSLLVLSLYYNQKFHNFVINNICDLNNFQIQKIIKIYYNSDDEIKLKLFQAEISYGYEYLGLIKRLVLTNLTQRMQLIYLSAFKYSLASSAIGPAGTGKSQTSKDIARICGKTCLIYNASESLSIDLVVRILKGMIVTGFWVCIDQFNRLNMQVLSLLSDQLAIIFKYKAMQQKMSVYYDRQTINFQPSFHLCTTYNPSYVGRQTIPKNVLKYFRTIALVNCDKKVICKLLFYTKGFKEADYLSEKLNQLFQKCQQLWNTEKLYDFGLRTLISIIQLSGMLYKGELNGQKQILQSIKILVVPRLSDNHKKIMGQLCSFSFALKTKIEGSSNNSSQVQNLHYILQVRLGIIMIGDILSNKSTIMSAYEQQHKINNRVQFISINSLTVDQLYGETNATTRIFKDGYLTKKIRQHILSIPDSVKFIINCTNLNYASPATISRSCIVCYKNKSISQILLCPDQKLKKRIIQVYEQLMKQLKLKLIYKLDERLIIHWINKFHTKSKLKLSFQSFFSFFAFIIEGMLNLEDKQLSKYLLHKHIDFEKQSIFDHYWDGDKWIRIDKVILTNHFQYDVMKQKDLHNLIVKNMKYKKIEHYMKIFLTKTNRNSEDMLMLIGKENSGKSSNIQYLSQNLNTKMYSYQKINISRKVQNEQFYNMIQSNLHKKSHRRKGMINGKEMVIFIDDLHLPDNNQYKFKLIISILTFLLEKKGFYNYNFLEFEALQDLHLIGNYNIKGNDIDLNNQFMKAMLPIFVSPFNKQEIKEIFKEIIGQVFISNKNKQIIYEEYSANLIECLNQVQLIPQPTFLMFSFNHYRHIFKSIIGWKLHQNSSKHDIKNIFIFEAQRIIISRFSNQQTISQIKQIFSKHFELGITRDILVHSFERNVNGTTIADNVCFKVDNFEDLMRQIQYICDEYVLYSENTSKGIVVFPQLCVLLCRISRGLRLKKGNISLIGLPRCGKKIIVQLCNHLLKGKIYRSNTKYDNKVWSELIKNSTKQSFISKLPSILLFQQYQFKDNSIKQELNTLLKTCFLANVYSQADYEELIFLFQSQLMKNRMPVNKQCTIKLFIKYLEKNLNIFLLFNPQAKNFKEDIISYPAISKYTEFYWIIEWPSQALMMIATQTIIESQIQQYLNILPIFHQISKQQTLKLTFMPHWEGLYLDFIGIFNKIYLQNKNKLRLKKQTLEKSFSVIKQTEAKLEFTRDQIKRLQPAILLLQKQTIKTIKSINLQKSNVQSINQQLGKKEVQISKVLAQANIVKTKLSISNEKVQYELKKAWQNVGLVKQSHISEIKVLSNPSDFIKMVVTAIVIIINDGQFQIIRNKTEDGLGTQQNYFATGQRFIFSKDSKQITKMLTEYNKEKLNKQKIALLEEKCLNHQRWSLAQAKSANKAIYYFFLWADAVVKYFRLYQQTIPLREQLTKITILVDQKTKEINIIKKELDIYQQKIKQLTKINKQKNQKLTQLSNQIKLFQKMLNRGHQILKEIQSEKIKWQQYEKIILMRQQYNFGNSLMCSALIIYTSMHTMEVRNLIMKKFINQMQQYHIKYNDNHKFWLMQPEEEIILKQQGIYYNDYVLDNLKIIQKTNKTNFIIDPEQEGLKYIRNKYKVQSTMFVQKINLKHKMFRKILEKSILQGNVLFIQIDGLSLPYLIQFLVNPKFKRNETNGLIQILLDEKTLYYNDAFKFYLFTSNQSQNYAIQLISKVTTTNFSISKAQLQQNLIDIIISMNFPEQKEELDDINKENIKNNIQLKNIQSKILNIFANMTNCEEILKTQDLLQILTSSNRLYQQIQKKIQDSNEKRIDLKKKRQHFRGKSHKTSKLYFQIRKIGLISSYYKYSFDWFIKLFRQNINNFSDVLSQQLAKGLPLDKKIIAPLTIAQSQFPQIPFKKLFNENRESREQVQKLYPFKVSKERLGKIIKKIQMSDIQNLNQLVIKNPQKFHNLFKIETDQILSEIPNQLSQLQFFQKIVLISCFRPDCIIKLLKNWLQINLGSTYNNQFLKIMQNTSMSIPILVLQNAQALTQSTQQIYKLSQLYYKQIKSICFIDTKSCSIQKIKILLQSGYDNDQWIIVQGFGQHHQQLIELIINFVEQLSFNKHEIFRLWIIIKDFQLKFASEKFIKMCGKVIFEEELQIHKKIGNMYMNQMVKLKNHASNFDINKKKYILHEMCVFHYMLEEKYKFKEKLWNQPMRFFESDLLLNLQYLYFTNADELKILYPNIVTHIVYGARLTSQEDIDTIELHIKETIKDILIQRNLFWQTVWADDTFPKSNQQCEFYTKNLLTKYSPLFKSLYQQYGITQYLKTHLKQKQYMDISHFYNKMLKSENKSDLISGFNQRLKILNSILKSNNNNLYVQIDQNSLFFSYFTDEYIYYRNMIVFIEDQLQFYGNKQTFNGQDWNICIEITNNIIPKQWNIKSILSLQSWITYIVQGQHFILSAISKESQTSSNTQYWKNIVFPLELTYNFNNLAYSIKKINQNKDSESCLIWYPEQNKQMNINFGIKVNRWYIWNAIFNNEIMPLEKGMIEQYYYNALPIGILTILSIQQRKLLKNYQKIPLYYYTIQYGNSPVKITQIYLPIFKNNDKQWIKRTKVHLTLTI